jgi:hypothetical protein
MDSELRDDTTESDYAQIPFLAVSILEPIRGKMVFMERALSAERSTRALTSAYRNERMVVFGNIRHPYRSLDRCVQVTRRSGSGNIRCTDKIATREASQGCSFRYAILERLHVCWVEVDHNQCPNSWT